MQQPTPKPNNVSDRFFKRFSDGFARLITYMERSRSALLRIGIVFVLILIVAIVVVARGDMWARQRRAPTIIPTQQYNNTTIQQSLTRSLDGVPVTDASSTSLAPYAVMVENSMDAWPLSGASEANVIFEAPVEGSITRFMLLFDPSSTTTQIGPVRSARPYFVEWANAYGAMYVHVGGSPDALDLIKSIRGFQDLNQFWHGNDFWRSSSRYAPHNVFTSMEKLNVVAIKQEVSTSTFDAWHYADETPAAITQMDIGASATEIDIPYMGAYAAKWMYASSTHLYQRFQFNRPQADADGSLVFARNVAVILTDSTVLDNVGRLEVRTTGSGKALLFRDGTVQSGTWSREKGKTIHFETEDGHDMLFAPGKTWISVVDDPAGFEEIVDK